MNASEDTPKNTDNSAATTPAVEPSAQVKPETTPAANAESSDPAKSKISIGSQRDAADVNLKPAQPKAVQAAVQNPIALKEAGQEPDQAVAEAVAAVEIKSTAGLGDDLDAEIAAALGEISMDDVVSKSETSETEIEPNTRVKAGVTKIHGDHVFVKLGAQQEGVAALHQFKEAPKEGDLVEIIVRSLNKEDGLYELAVPGASASVADWDDLQEGNVVDARVTGSNTGGLEVMVNSIRGFMPASQIDRFRVEDLSTFIGEKFPAVVMEVKPQKKRLVLSRRAILERENEEKRKELVKELEAGQIRDGVVTKLMDFGAFVDLGGLEGLIHISKVAWTRVRHPSEVLSVGEKVRVKVESFDPESFKVSLSHRDTLEHPWESMDELEENKVMKGVVKKIADFGAFVEISPGVEGLVHISELSFKRVSRVSSVVQPGQEIDVKILSVDQASQKISLSHKACLTPPKSGDSTKKKPEEADLPARELTVQARDNEPLRGGTDRKSGGEGIGLNW